jgi:hypothetical protein
VGSDRITGAHIPFTAGAGDAATAIVAWLDGAPDEHGAG